MSDISPERAQELLDLATPGEWKLSQDWIELGVPDNTKTISSFNGGYIATIGLYSREQNAALIAAAPDLARAYIEAAAELARAQRACETLGAIVDRNAEDICRIAGVEMPEDGDADFERAWSTAYELRTLLIEAAAREQQVREIHQDDLGFCREDTAGYPCDTIRALDGGDL